jgi:tRNA(fMet)-specific endonuclease VapC
MLDTNICIYLIKKNRPEILRHLRRTEPADVCLSAITVSELTYGVEKSARPERNRVALTRFLAPFTILPYDDHAALQYGRVRAQLEAMGQPIGALDTLIGAHALSRNLILVTNNIREFQKIQGLRVENWTE